MLFRDDILDCDIIKVNIGQRIRFSKSHKMKITRIQRKEVVGKPFT